MHTVKEILPPSLVQQTKHTNQAEFGLQLQSTKPQRISTALQLKLV